MTTPGSTRFKGPKTESALTFDQRLCGPHLEKMGHRCWEFETDSLASSTSIFRRGDQGSGRCCHLPKVTMKQVPRC